MEPITTVRDLGVVIRVGRRGRGWSQADLAQHSGTSRSFISDVESGKPTVEFGRVLAVLASIEVELSVASPSTRVEAQPTVDLDELLRGYGGDE